MIEHFFDGGKIIITGSAFGHVGVGDETFLSRLEEHHRKPLATAWNGESLSSTDNPPRITGRISVSESFAPRPRSSVALLRTAPLATAWMDQVHGAKIAFVQDYHKDVHIFHGTDGLMTHQKNLLLITKTADCVPILLWNTDDHVIAALHCGWRGFFSGIIESFIRTCRERNISPEKFSAFLGPHLRASHFEVQQDFVDQIPSGKISWLMKKDDQCTYDITQGVYETLYQSGIKDIHDSQINTYNSPDYFSYRTWSQLPLEKRPKKYSTFANTIVFT